MNIEKCPFCGGSDVRSERNEKDELMYCACLECGAFGPAVYSPSGSDDKISFKAWNTRKHLMSSEFAKLKTANDEAKIRLYGILWLLVEHEIISEGRARELGNMPLYKMIDQCMEYRVNNDEP